MTTQVSTSTWYQRRQQRTALGDTFATEIIRSRPDWHWCYITLTMKQGIVIDGSYLGLDHDHAHKAVKELLKRLNLRVYNHAHRRFNHHLACVPVVEIGKAGEERFHIHMLLEVPRHMWQDLRSFFKVVRDEWSKSPWSYRKKQIRELRSNENVIGWINYLMKDYSEDDRTVDFRNVHYGHTIHQGLLH